jgi:heme/copper-type cytochrome/quinol oxidase subunit 1
MRQGHSSMFLLMGVVGFLIAAVAPLVTETVDYSIALHPNGYTTNHRKEHPFVLTGAAFAVFSGLCFLAAALAGRNRGQGPEQ